jgi:catechol 2,3-dioxygenase-like lactoylglutathione lyase family enzyme
MIDHMSVGVADLARSGAFYNAILEPLGYVRLFDHPRALGYGPPGARDEAFAIVAAGEGGRAPAGQAWHVAFIAPSHQAVDDFYSIALQHGATDEGPPGFRPDYGPSYYTAFIRDLDGNRLEAACRD